MAAVQPDPDDLHEWVSFEEPDRTWLIDITFLSSTWQCIWDAGCLGIHETATVDLAEGCCSYGAHFADDADRGRVMAAGAALTDQQWQFRRPIGEAIVADPDSHPAPVSPDDTEPGDAEAWTTALVEGACVFLNRPGFPGGHGCALHRGAIESRTSVIDAKPEVCWQLPLRLEHHEDENGHLVSTLRQWRRRDRGAAGSDFAWWCTDDALAFGAADPVAERLRDEIVALVGADVHARILTYLAGRRDGTPVAHPALGHRS